MLVVSVVLICCSATVHCVCFPCTAAVIPCTHTHTHTHTHKKSPCTSLQRTHTTNSDTTPWWKTVWDCKWDCCFAWQICSFRVGRLWQTLAHPPTLVKHVESAVESQINSVSNLSVLSISTHTCILVLCVYTEWHYVTQCRHTVYVHF